MSRATMTNTVGVEYLTSNIEGGEFSLFRLHYRELAYAPH